LSLHLANPHFSFFFLYIYPVALELALFAWAALTILSLRDGSFRYLGRLLTRRGLLVAGVIVFGSALARTFLAPPRHQVYFDEFVHEDVALNIANDNIFGESAAGGADRYRSIQTSAWPGGAHVMLGGVFKLVGSGERTAFVFNALLAGATVAVVFFLSTLLFLDQRVGCAAAFLLAFQPIYVRFSGATDLTVASCLWISLSILSLAHYLERKDFLSYLLFIVTLSYALNVRFENLCLLPVAGYLLFQERRGHLWTIREYAATGILLVFAGLTIVLALHNRSSGATGFDGSLGQMSWNLVNNLPANLLYLALSPAISFILLPAAAYGLFVARKQYSLWIRALAALGLTYLVLCAAHVRGGFDIGTSERLAAPTILCLCLVAGYGAIAISDMVRFKRLCLGALALSFILFCWRDYGKGPLGRYEAEYRLVLESAARLPADAYIITFCPPLIIAAAHRPAVSAFHVMLGGPNLLERLDVAGAMPLVLLKDAWWYKFAPEAKRLEEMLRTLYRFEPINTAAIDGKEYGFYLLSRWPSAAPFKGPMPPSPASITTGIIRLK